MTITLKLEIDAYPITGPVYERMLEEVGNLPVRDAFTKVLQEEVFSNLESVDVPITRITTLPQE